MLAIDSVRSGGLDFMNGGISSCAQHAQLRSERIVDQVPPVAVCSTACNVIRSGHHMHGLAVERLSNERPVC